MIRQDLIPHLFRSESAKIISVLCRRFGLSHIEIAEDITSETFMAALESWPYHGLPENPAAWLYTVAKNKTKNYLSRQKLFDKKISKHLIHDASDFPEESIDLSDKNITDSQLRMLFAVCHPSISVEARTGLALRILCGFGIDEIATAFLSNKETINKRLTRARDKLRSNDISLEYPGDEQLSERLDNVLLVIYLLFNEGYYSETNDHVIKEDLCYEAMRLCGLLLENPITATPVVYALLAMMCFHSSRFDARRGNNGEMILYDEQDENAWNRELITRGTYLISQAAVGDQLTKYHLEATIAYWGTIKEKTIENWRKVLDLYNLLLQIEYSPVAALNRTFTFAQVYGYQKGLEEALKLKLETNPYYFMLLGELCRETDPTASSAFLGSAFTLSRSASEQQLIQKKLEQIRSVTKKH